MAAPPPWEGWDEPPSCPPKGGTIRMAAPPPWEGWDEPPSCPPGGENNPHGGPSPLGEAGRGLLPFFVRMCQIVCAEWGGGHLDEAFGIFG